MNLSQQKPILDLPPPSSHPEVSYIEEWKAANELIGHTVYGLSWHEDYLVGCTSSGTILVWHIPFDNNRDNNEDNDKWSFHHYDDDDEKQEGKREDQQLIKPIIKFQASSQHEGDNNDDDNSNIMVLYSTKFVYVRQKNFLGVSGEKGILLYSWDDILQKVVKDNNDHSSSQTKATKRIQPKHHFQPQIGKYEFNDFDYDDDFNIFGASDLGYKWNMDSGKLIAAYEGRKRKHHNSYLHTIQVLSSSTFQGGHSIVLMGGEDGTLGVWDHKCDKLIEDIHIKTRMNEDASLLHSYNYADSGNKVSFTPWKQQSDLWISHVESSESSNWWNVCGGADEDNNGTAGHLSCWHAPTRSLVAGCATRETPNRMARNSSSNIISTIANESVVSYWSATQIDREQRCWTTSPCSYALAIREHDGLTAVGGVGTRIDILEESGARLYSISALL